MNSQQEEIETESAPVALKGGAHEEEDIPGKEGEEDIGRGGLEHEREDPPPLALEEQVRHKGHLLHRR